MIGVISREIAAIPMATAASAPPWPQEVPARDKYAVPTVADAQALQTRWALVRDVRAEVQKELEQLRIQGTIGSSLAARVEIRAAGERYAALADLGDDLRFVLITSQASVTRVSTSAEQGIMVHASRDSKCPRCWHYRSDVGADPAHAEICGRCVANLYGEGEARAYA